MERNKRIHHLHKSQTHPKAPKRADARDIEESKHDFTMNKELPWNIIEFFPGLTRTVRMRLKKLMEARKLRKSKRLMDVFNESVKILLQEKRITRQQAIQILSMGSTAIVMMGCAFSGGTDVPNAGDIDSSILTGVNLTEGPVQLQEITRDKIADTIVEKDVQPRKPKKQKKQEEEKIQESKQRGIEIMKITEDSSYKEIKKAVKEFTAIQTEFYMVFGNLPRLSTLKPEYAKKVRDIARKQPKAFQETQSIHEELLKIMNKKNFVKQVKRMRKLQKKIKKWTGLFFQISLHPEDFQKEKPEIKKSSFLSVKKLKEDQEFIEGCKEFEKHWEELKEKTKTIPSDDTEEKKKKRRTAFRIPKKFHKPYVTSVQSKRAELSRVKNFEDFLPKKQSFEMTVGSRENEPDIIKYVVNGLDTPYLFDWFVDSVDFEKGVMSRKKSDFQEIKKFSEIKNHLETDHYCIFQGKRGFNTIKIPPGYAFSGIFPVYSRIPLTVVHDKNNGQYGAVFKKNPGVVKICYTEGAEKEIIPEFQEESKEELMKMKKNIPPKLRKILVSGYG